VNTDALLWIAIVGAVAACVTAIAARSLHYFSRHELEEICARRATPERCASILRDHERVAVAMELVAMLALAITACAGTLWAWIAFDHESWSPSLTIIATVMAIWLVAVITSVWLPRMVARIASAPFLYATWPLWNALGSLALPLVWTNHAIDALLRRVTGRAPEKPDEEAFEEEIRTIVTEGHREGLLEEDAREMIESVIELGDAVVSRIMTPRTEIHMLSLNTPWEEVVESVIDSGHTRVPVYDKNRDDIAGILYSKDLLPELAKPADEERRPLSELLRKPLFVPETKPVDDLLKVFQKSRTHIAMALDEFGGVSGLVTIEDVLEEIVGEIDDEYDQKTEAKVRKIDDDTCEAVGRAHIDEINALMGFELPEDENLDTIGGFVFTEFGRVPAAGESITWRDAVKMTVLEASRRRVNRVRLERVRKESLEAV
jgi:CBS domain containing-hemolysin-like protein